MREGSGNADHPLCRKERIRRSDLKDQVVLSLGPGHQLHDFVLGLCEEYGALLLSDYEATSLAMIREMVVTGLGITFLPGLYVRRELTSHSSLEIR
ncbi:MAG: LysR substrate-binding domain-containing protein [Methyloceanibacter sp.]|uniref:LysR substrate-binding domain-containing protein n=1 Tax=Methyloceanibacter sp. TaxID=1965321 RepID=UPI003D9B2CC6